MNRKAKTTTLLAALLVFVTSIFLPSIVFAAVGGRLKVSDNHRYLQYENGKPFFYLGDTAWELFQRLNRGEATSVCNWVGGRVD